MSRFQIAARHLTEPYLAPVPSQFCNLPRAMKRADANHPCEIGKELAFSTLGYVRALSEDCLRWTGGMMDAHLGEEFA